MKNKLKIFPAYIYQIAFICGLAICGVEPNGAPQFVGTSEQWRNYGDRMELFNLYKENK